MERVIGGKYKSTFKYKGSLQWLDASSTCQAGWGRDIYNPRAKQDQQVERLKMNMSTLNDWEEFYNFTAHTRVWTTALRLKYAARARFLSQCVISGFNLLALPTFPLLP